MKTNSKAVSQNAKNNQGKSLTTTSKKSKLGGIDSTPATERARSRHRHSHGMNNEGTNVDYEEQR